MIIEIVFLIATSAGMAPVQDRPLPAVVESELVSGVPQNYTVRSTAGELISGTFELRGAPAMAKIGLYDEQGSKVKEVSWGVVDEYGPMSVGFVTPKDGVYRIQITSTDPASHSYTLRTERRSLAQRMTGTVSAVTTVRYPSARLERLKRDVNAREAGAVERFWAEAEARGGPIVEAIAENDAEVLVTFLWRETYETHNVLALWEPAESVPQDYFMSRVPGTNVWYKTVRVLRGSRFSYQLAPNDRTGEPHFTAQIDPLNPRTDRDCCEEGSILETPGAPDESWFRRTPAVRGAIMQHSLDSILLKGRREISVYTPPGYSPNGHYALLILLDGPGAYLGALAAPTQLDNLIGDHRIRPTVVCFVTKEPSGVSANPAIYAASLATELVPWLRSSYAVSKDPRDVVIGGNSLRGRTAVYTALTHPNEFGNVLSQSSGFQRPQNTLENPLIRMAIDLPKAPVRFYIDLGLYEGRFDNTPSLPADERALWENRLLGTRHFRDILQAKGYDVTYRETGGAHEYVHWAATFAEGLIALLAPTK